MASPMIPYAMNGVAMCCQITYEMPKKELDKWGKIRYTISGMKPRFTQVKKGFWTKVKRGEQLG